MGDRTYRDPRVLGERAQSAFPSPPCSTNSQAESVSLTRLCTLREYQGPDSNGKILVLAIVDSLRKHPNTHLSPTLQFLEVYQHVTLFTLLPSFAREFIGDYCTSIRRGLARFSSRPRTLS